MQQLYIQILDYTYFIINRENKITQKKFDDCYEYYILYDHPFYQFVDVENIFGV